MDLQPDQTDPKVHTLPQRIATGCVHALWHEHLFSFIGAHAYLGLVPLASLSKDGDIASFVLDRLGYRTIRGSSSRGGASAKTILTREAKAGAAVAISIDGPRGPRRQSKRGIFDIAAAANIPILLMTAVPRSKWILRKSWDQFNLPKPFTKVEIRYGPMIEVKAARDPAQFQAQKQTVAELLNGLEDDVE